VQYRRLGSSELEVSEIALGSWLTFGTGIDRDRAAACVNRAFELGINLIDTANVYGRGAAEELLGDLLRDRPRDSYVLATKLYFPMGAGDRGLSRAQVLKQIDASLRRLRTEYVDLYQCHRYDRETPLEETMDALTEVVRDGKARHIGFSEWSSGQIEAAAGLPGIERFVSSQPQYSLLWRLPERAVIPTCAPLGISQIVWSPLGQGVLTGKYRSRSSPPADSRATSEKMGWAMGRFLTDEVFAAVDRLRPVAARAGLTLAQLALAWVLREPNVAAAIVGASRPEQLDDNVGASGVELEPATLAAIDEALRGVVLDPG
jgi:aryl-alcohol dehydrogenase-like predicted oxidoreductase